MEINPKVMRRPRHISAISIALVLILGIILYPYLSNLVSFQWGTVELEVPKLLAIMSMPAIIAILQGIFELSSTDNKDSQLIRSLTVIFVSLIHILLLIFNLGISIPIIYLFIASTLIFIAISIYIKSKNI
jgi:hypothetical protein